MKTGIFLKKPKDMSPKEPSFLQRLVHIFYYLHHVEPQRKSTAQYLTGSLPQTQDPDEEEEDEGAGLEEEEPAVTEAQIAAAPEPTVQNEPAVVEQKQEEIPEISLQDKVCY